MTREEVDHAIETLKEMCDPRGHELLDAIGSALFEASDAVSRLDNMFESITVDGEFDRKVPLT